MGVERLADGDRFNIIRFSNDASSLFPTSQPVNPSSRVLAGRFIASLQAGGGTEMRAPGRHYPVAKLTLGTPAQQLVVLDGSSGRNLAFGPVHDPASVLPGALGNSVIEGHRDTHFKVLRDLKIQDPIEVELANGHRLSFTVTDLRVISTLRWRIALESDTPRLILVTCYPFDAITPGGPLRYVVSADLRSHRP
jgi:sortase A